MNRWSACGHSCLLEGLWWLSGHGYMVQSRPASERPCRNLEPCSAGTDVDRSAQKGSIELVTVLGCTRSADLAKAPMVRSVCLDRNLGLLHHRRQSLPCGQCWVETDPGSNSSSNLMDSLMDPEAISGLSSCLPPVTVLPCFPGLAQLFIERAACTTEPPPPSHSPTYPPQITTTCWLPAHCSAHCGTVTLHDALTDA